MKYTGIVRRVDDLGRIIIPKEVRSSLDIQEGDPLELYVNGDCVVFQKCAYLCNYINKIQSIREQIKRDTSVPNSVQIVSIIDDLLEALGAKERT